MRVWFFRALVFLIFAGSFSVVEARKKISVGDSIRVELNGILKAADLLHAALVKQNESGMEDSIDQLLKKAKAAEAKVAASSGFNRRHILEVLKSVRNSLELTKEYSGYRRSEALRSVFDGIVQIATNYKLDRYRIFYCNEDRVVWLQKGWTAKHPFNREDLKSCGLAIR